MSQQNTDVKIHFRALTSAMTNITHILFLHFCHSDKTNMK